VPIIAREIGDEEELTQYGTTTDQFRKRPRWGKENAVSLLLGGWHPLEASRKVRGIALEDGTDAARYTTAGTLRANGFRVTHTPGYRNRDHVSVHFDGVWDEQVCEAFDRCFSPIEVDEVTEVDFDEGGE
jgi:hypothetical protein